MVKDYLEFRQKVDANNFATLCRFCLEKSIKNKSDAVCEITTKKIPNLFNTFMDMDFNLSLIHPYTFCETCINALEASMKFREHLRNVETFWNQYIGEMETIKTENDLIDRISCNVKTKRKNVSAFSCGTQTLQSNIEKKNKSIENENDNSLNNTNPKPTATISETSIVVEPLPEAEHIEHIDLPDFSELFQDFDNDHFDEIPEILTTKTDAAEASSPPRKKAKRTTTTTTKTKTSTTTTKETKATTSTTATTTARKRKTSTINSPLPAETATKTTIARHNSEVDEDGEYIDEPNFDLVEKESINKRENGLTVKCSKCSKEFKSKTCFLKHKRLVHFKEFDARSDKNLETQLYRHIPIICQICGQHIRSIERLAGHQRVTHKKASTFECHICKRMYSSKCAIKRHFARKHTIRDKDEIEPNFSILCHICGVIIAENNLGRHLKTTHRNGQLGRMLRLPDSLLPIIKCSFCTQLTEFRFKKRYLEHLKSMHPDKYRLHMRITQQQYQSQNNFNKKNLQCVVCSKKNFVSKFQLDEHRQEHYQFQCNICCRKYATQELLDTHFQTHSKLNRPFKCPICLALFTREAHLKGHHLRKHTTERPYKCDKCDNKSFAQMYELRSHQRIVHLKIKPYKCAYCERTHASKSDLNHHESTHTGVYKFRCHVCDRKFASPSQLNLHVAVMHTQK